MSAVLVLSPHRRPSLDRRRPRPSAMRGGPRSNLSESWQKDTTRSGTIRRDWLSVSLLDSGFPTLLRSDPPARTLRKRIPDLADHPPAVSRCKSRSSCVRPPVFVFFHPAVPPKCLPFRPSLPGPLCGLLGPRWGVHLSTQPVSTKIGCCCQKPRSEDVWGARPSGAKKSFYFPSAPPRSLHKDFTPAPARQCQNGTERSCCNASKACKG